MFDMNHASVHSPHSGRMAYKVEFPTLDHFLEEVARRHIRSVRIDVFQDSAQSELSFVYYVTLTLYVTATAGHLLYEYKEPVVTVASTEPKVTDASEAKEAWNRMLEVETQLASLGLQISHGRLS